MDTNPQPSPSSEAYNSDQHPLSHPSPLQLQPSLIPKPKETTANPQERNLERTQATTATETQVNQRGHGVTFPVVDGGHQSPIRGYNGNGTEFGDLYPEHSGESSNIKKNLQRKREPQPSHIIVVVEVVEENSKEDPIDFNKFLIVSDPQIISSGVRTRSQKIERMMRKILRKSPGYCLPNHGVRRLVTTLQKCEKQKRPLSVFFSKSRSCIMQKEPKMRLIRDPYFKMIRRLPRGTVAVKQNDLTPERRILQKMDIVETALNLLKWKADALNKERTRRKKKERPKKQESQNSDSMIRNGPKIDEALTINGFESDEEFIQ